MSAADEFFSDIPRHMRPDSDDPPEWFKPGYVSEHVEIVFNGEPFRLHRDVLRQYSPLNLSHVSKEDGMALLRTLAALSAQKLVNLNNGVTDMAQTNQFQQVFPTVPRGNSQIIQQIPQPMTPIQQENPVPRKILQVRVANMPLQMTLYFHEIIVNNPFIVLVFDQRSVGFPVSFPDPGHDLYVKLQETDQEFCASSLGQVFSHNNYIYCLLIINTPKNTESDTKVEEVSFPQNTDL